MFTWWCLVLPFSRPANLGRIECSSTRSSPAQALLGSFTLLRQRYGAAATACCRPARRCSADRAQPTNHEGVDDGVWAHDEILPLPSSPPSRLVSKLRGTKRVLHRQRDTLPTGRGAPRAARGGACRSDQTKIEPRGGAHYTEARGGAGVRRLPVAIITVLTRSTFLNPSRACPP